MQKNIDDFIILIEGIGDKHTALDVRRATMTRSMTMMTMIGVA